MKKIFATIYFIASVATTSVNAAQYSYQPTRSTQVLGVIKKPVKAAQYSYQPTRSTQTLAVINKSANESDVIITQKEVNPALKTQQVREKSETVIEDVEKEEKIFSSSEKIITDMNPANGSDLDKKLEKNRRFERKTQGHYIGFDMLHNKLSFYEKNSSPIDGVVEEQKLRPSSSGYGVGFGLSYKYAINFNDFFIAPGIFLERTNTHVNGEVGTYFNNPTTASNISLRVKGRYGVIVDVGYDVNKIISPYLVGGYSMVNYISENGFNVIGYDSQSVLKKGTSGGFLYGAGMKINYDKRMSFNIEFNEQSFQTKNDITPLNEGYTAVYDATLKTLKLGVLYNF